jgi:hypothetical protein
LVKKGAIRAQRDGRRYLYSPIIERDQWLSDESVGLLDRLFHGRIAPFVAHFSHSRKLSKRDIAAPMLIGAWQPQVVVPTDFEAKVVALSQGLVTRQSGDITLVDVSH